jgi:hypothetical protein
MSTKDFLGGSNSLQTLAGCTSPPRSPARWPIPSQPHSCPSLRPPPQPKQRLVVGRDVLGGGFVVIVHLESHDPNKGNVFCPILGLENEVCNLLARLVCCSRSEDRGRQTRLIPNKAVFPLLEHRCPFFSTTYKAGERRTPEEIGLNRLPLPPYHLTPNGNEILEGV